MASSIKFVLTVIYIYIHDKCFMCHFHDFLKGKFGRKHVLRKAVLVQHMFFSKANLVPSFLEASFVPNPIEFLPPLLFYNILINQRLWTVGLPWHFVCSLWQWFLVSIFIYICCNRPFLSWHHILLNLINLLRFVARSILKTRDFFLYN